MRSVDGGGDRIDLLAIRHIESVGPVRHDAARAGALGTLGGRRLGRPLVDIGAEHRGAPFGQGVGGRPADPAACAGDQRRGGLEGDGRALHGAGTPEAPPERT